ncbi:MAG: ribokinase [Aestuariibacter sp.]
MAIINFGSINIDHVYQVPHFVQPGETLSSNSYQKLLGGKGANQSFALAKAGVDVRHVGLINESDFAVKQAMIRAGVDCKHVKGTDTPSGHAIIQVADSGENSIVLYAGANHELSQEHVKAALSEAQPGEWILTQNETSAIAEAMEQAKQQGLKIAFNPAPMTDSVRELPLEKVDLLIVNEVEAEALSGKAAIEDIEQYFREALPNTNVILTLGSKGAKLLTQTDSVFAAAFKVDAIDTTAAGDTFIGFFLSAYVQGTDAESCIRRACAASAIAVTRLGAAQSIPSVEEVDAFLQKHS